jgi:hypothetical protein
MHILRENIHDNRFLRLIEGTLKAGYCEEWTYHPTFSGSPQGGIVSPILSNIYMDRLDRYIEDTLIPAYTRGKRRRPHPAYHRLNTRIQQNKRRGHPERNKPLRREMQQYPALDPYDPGYRRLRYLRYADDFLLGFAGPRAEAEEIKAKLTEFLKSKLHLTLAEEKTLITSAINSRARFLGYEIGVWKVDTKRDARQERSINGGIGLSVPEDVIQRKRKRYLRDGKVVHRPELMNDSEYDIVAKYQGEYRGLVHYYGMAHNLNRLKYVRYTMETSLLKTIAGKNRTTLVKTWTRLKSKTQTRHGPRVSLKVTVEREGKKPLVAIFGGLSLSRRKTAIEERIISPYATSRSEIVERLLKNECEVCGSKECIEMHHIRKLADLNKQGRREKPLWMKTMIARKRKSIPLCRRCHMDIHSNKPRSQRHGNRRAG